MTSETKELRNQIVKLKKSLDSAPKADHASIKQQIADLEQQLADLRKQNQSNEEPVIVAEAEKIEFKPSKSMLKKQALNTQMEAQRRAALESLSSSSSKIIADAEETDLAGQFAHHSLILFPITPDGNCLFSAVRHQLTQQHMSNIEDLRQLATMHIQDNAAEYEAFMVDESLQDYCQRMSRSGEWGGQLELVALSKALGASIRVFQAHSEPLIFSPDNSCGSSVLNISYHRHAYALGEHYNSLIKKH